MKKIHLKTYLSELWQPAILLLIGISIVAGLLTYNVQAIAPSLAPSEFLVINRTALDVLSDPVFLHQQIIQKITYILTSNELLAVRITPIITGIVTVLAFFSVVSMWFTKRVALFASALLATSSWFLHISRIGTTDAAYMLPLAGVTAAVWLHSRRRVGTATFLLIIIGLTLLYVPGMIWFLLPAIVWQRKGIVQFFRRLHRWQVVLAGLLLIAGFIPALVALARDPTFALRLAALPESISSIENVPLESLRIISDISFLRRPDPLFGIGRIPYLSIFSTALAALGVFAAIYNRRLDRIKLLAGLIVGGLLLAGSSTTFSAAFLLTPLYLLIAGGLALLLQQWFTVFPKNPFARQTGVIIVMLAVAINILFGITRYFIAWPHTPQTAEAFNTQIEN